MKILGFDIGGTKCEVIIAEWDGSNIKLLKKEKSPTALNNFSPKIKNHSPSPPFEPVTRIFLQINLKKQN